MSSSLPIVERFHSLQGEGIHFGKSAFFIRLAKCNVGCEWCDTKQSWNEKNHPQQSTLDISTNVAKAQINGPNQASNFNWIDTAKQIENILLQV